MYTKHETSKQKQAFWTSFGAYMKPVLSADGEKISWLNYKTGNKDIAFKMDVDRDRAILSIVTDTDPAVADRLFQLRPLFEESLGEQDWSWQRHASTTTVSKELTGINIFQREDWPAIISFLKPRLMALDAWWSMARYQFENCS